MKTLTIFTPSYNRAHLLPRLYESLLDQTSQDFLWLVVDDGSQDETQDLIQRFIAEQKIEIRYVYQENQGMHGAHNLAYESITTELNTCIDSDDFMPPSAVELILNFWKSLPDTKALVGMAGLDQDMNGNLIGTPFTRSEITIESFYRQGGKGDKKLVYKTDVMKALPPYPLFEGEKYVGLNYKYLLADKLGHLATLNNFLVTVDYQTGGSSLNMFHQYYKNPKGFAFLRKESIKVTKSKKRKFLDSIHYVSSSLLARNFSFISESPNKLMTIIVIPAGFLLFTFIVFKNRKQLNSTEL